MTVVNLISIILCSSAVHADHGVALLELNTLIAAGVPICATQHKSIAKQLGMQHTDLSEQWPPPREQTGHTALQMMNLPCMHLARCKALLLLCMVASMISGRIHVWD